MSSSAQIQQALLLKSKRGSLEVGARPIPQLGAGELLVKVHATSLNPVDWKIQVYGLFIEDFPAVLGTDVSGEVVKVGKDVVGFKEGDRVFCQGTWESDGASFQQYTIATAATTAKIPDSLSYEAASTVPVAFTCAYVGLYNRRPHGMGLPSPLIPGQKGKNAGEPIAILGGSSSVGQYAIQLAKLSGFSPIITTASPKHADYLKSLGATHVIDRRTTWSDIRIEIARLTDEPLKYIYDTISSAETQQGGHDLFAGAGTLVVTLHPEVKDKKDFVDIVQVMGILKLPQNQPLLPQMYKHLTAAFEDGSIKPNRYTVLDGGLGGIVQGLDKLQNDEVSGGKLVAQPWV